MRHEEFAEIINPLRLRHPLHFTPDVSAEVYRIIGHLNAYQGREVIGKLMLQSRFAPTDKEFKDAVHELFRPRTFVKPKEDRFDPIFSDEERAEIWTFVKKVAAGEVPDYEVKAYTDVLNEAIQCFYKR